MLRNHVSFLIFRSALTLFVLLGLIFGSIGSLPATAQAAAPSPTLEIQLPTQVEVGDPIAATFVLAGSSDVAGYEASLLFDPAVAHLNGLEQRKNDLRKFGRDVGPLGPLELPNGVSFGLYSCPVADCVQSTHGQRASGGGHGKLRLATLTLVADQPGQLELVLGETRFVDSTGQLIPVTIPETRWVVQVGADGQAHAAPASVALGAAAGQGIAQPVDVTGDGVVTHADVMEVALAWTVAREGAGPCSAESAPSADVNGDGCVDVADTQQVVANYSSGADAQSKLPKGGADPHELPPGLLPESDAEPQGPPSEVQPGDAADPEGLQPDAQPAGEADPQGLQPDAQPEDAADPQGLQPEAQAAGEADPQELQLQSGTQPAGETQQLAVETTAMTFTVNSTGDQADASIGNGRCATSTGTCTLRAAIAEANRHSGPDTIAFNIGGTGPHTIQLYSQLPSLSDSTGPTTINGFTQPGAVPNSHAQLNNAVMKIQVVGKGESGTGTFSGLPITSAGNRVRGLVFYRLHRAIWLAGSGAYNNVIAGNFIGTNAAGTYYSTIYSTPANGVHLRSGVSSNVIGGTAYADRNVISGSASNGVAMFDEATDNNVVINNIVGLKPNGTGRLPNGNHGVDINAAASNNRVGGTGTNERNVVSGNGHEGIEISHYTSTQGNQIVGNFVGTDVTGNNAPTYAYNGLNGTNYTGVNLEDGVRNNIVRNNVIGGKGSTRGGAGLTISGSYSSGNQVYNNRIGIGLTGNAIANVYSGVLIQTGANRNKIGPGNIIAYNPQGVRVKDSATDYNSITRNRIFGNSGLGIDLDPVGSVNTNDSGDGDTGPNQQLNFPVITSRSSSTVAGTACAGCTVEVFQADAGSGAYGEGKTFLGSGKALSNGTFSVAISGLTSGAYVTATATDSYGNTSEFARNR
ncbi:MAG TPA: CSLREA domain-containing protein [Herpetosiphonaceae bacterium]|nr:CSLREA domain-containing protein [Herpetosiphonaceae bacterium]